MASLADVVAFQTSLGHLTTLTMAELVAFWRSLNTDDPAGAAQDVRDFLPDLLDTYVPLSAELAAGFYDESRDAAAPAGRFFAEPVDAVSSDRTQRMISWAVAPLFRKKDVLEHGLMHADELDPDPDMALSRLSGGTQLFVADGARDTVADNVDKDPAKPRYARHASSNACAFCILMSTRGAVYRSAESAGQGRKYHDHCHCVPVAVWPTETYEPAPYVKDWEKAYVNARRDGGSMKSILSNLRADLGVH